MIISFKIMNKKWEFDESMLDRLLKESRKLAVG